MCVGILRSISVVGIAEADPLLSVLGDLNGRAEAHIGEGLGDQRQEIR